MRFGYRAQANPTSQQQPFQQQQYQQTQQAPQQQASPYKAPDMSAYAQPSGGYNAYNVPRSAPEGARSNDLSGSVPANQAWGQAYNQAAGQYGVPGATSFTMPGSFTSQGYNPTTGQFGEMTGGQSFDGNMAYNAIDSRPPPVSAGGTGLGGNSMPFQDTLSQREAFVGNLSQRLGQYSGGQLSGPVTFDPGQLMSQADDQLANGAFYNPFSQAAESQRGQQNPDVQRAMGNANQYMQGSFDNPFGQQTTVPQPSFGQPAYSGGQLSSDVQPNRQAPASARPIASQSQGTSYNPQAAAQGLPDVPEEEAPPARGRYGYRAQAKTEALPAQEEEPATPSNKAQLAKIDSEINKWQRATYGTRQGVGPPAAWQSHIQALQRLRNRAEAGDAAALAWSPKMEAPPPNVTPTVPVNRRGSAARFGGMRRNGDNRR
jgi:hypothetical protein